MLASAPSAPIRLSLTQMLTTPSSFFSPQLYRVCAMPSMNFIQPLLSLFQPSLPFFSKRPRTHWTAPCSTPINRSVDPAFLPLPLMLPSSDALGALPLPREGPMEGQLLPSFKNLDAGCKRRLQMSTGDGDAHNYVAGDANRLDMTEREVRVWRRGQKRAAPDEGEDIATKRARRAFEQYRARSASKANTFRCAPDIGDGIS